MRSEKTEQELQQLEGMVESILFYNPENGYTVADLDCGGSLFTAAGLMGELGEGETVLLTGRFVTTAKYGDQFQAESCQRRLPENAQAIQKFLASKAVKGAGPKMAARIVERFGDRTLDILERAPERLLEIKGMNRERLDLLSQSFQQSFGFRRLMIWLSEMGLPPAAATLVWKRWGQFSMDVLRENPYALCQVGLNFLKADEAAKKLDIAQSDTRRVIAGLAYILEENASAGHTCLPTERLEKLACQALDINDVAFYDGLDLAYADRMLISYEKKERPYTFLPDYFYAEQYIAQRIGVARDFLLDTGDSYDILIDLEEENQGIQYADFQRRAISLALSQGLLILTGGPGTGKTTTLNGIISIYEQKGMRVALTAPTGRAAKRLADLTGREAQTIHRFLGLGKDWMVSIHVDPPTYKPCDVLVIDEMSMVDSLLFAKLLRCVKLSCRLILVGDRNQLPSVGAGNLLGDLIDSKVLTTVRLTEIFRQARESLIITNAHRIVHGEMPDLAAQNRQGDFFFFQRAGEEAAVSTLTELYLKRLPKAYGWTPAEDIQILSPARKGPLGVIALNKRIQQEINPPSPQKPELGGPVYTFREGDRVMQIRNNYEAVWTRDGEPGAGIFNGDMGTIRKIRTGAQALTVDFEGRLAEYPRTMLNQLELAYAVTVHKSQGSEFLAVLLALPNGFDKLCYRSLLYTAVTRARRLLVLVGAQSRLETMVENNRRTRRYTCLRDMLTAAVSPAAGVSQTEEETVFSDGGAPGLNPTEE